jgi:hypothetical protein
MASQKNHPLLRVWRTASEWSQVEYRVSRKKGDFCVVAVDTFDNERADVFEAKWNARTDILSFACHWNCTGRFLRCRLQAIMKDKIELTYTYTDTELYIRATKSRA